MLFLDGENYRDRDLKSGDTPWGMREGEQELREKKMQWMIFPGTFVLRFLPGKMKRWLQKRIESSLSVEPGRKKEDKSLEILTKEISVLCWGLLFLIAVSCVMNVFPKTNPVHITRNLFGEGEQEIVLVLKKGKDTRETTFSIGERELSDKELQSLTEEFFKKLEINMRGDNPSLSQVNKKLIFDPSLEGYPFQIEYQPENPDYIEWDGNPGEEAKKLKEKESRQTAFAVKAVCGEFEAKCRFPVMLVGKNVFGVPGVFKKAELQLKKIEKQTRKNQEVVFPSVLGEVEVHVKGEESRKTGIFLLFGCIPWLIVVRNHMARKEKQEKIRKETVQDFSMVVHLLTLYMGAGLSFASAVHRIVCDYQNGHFFTVKRYVFDKMEIMDRQMRMGVSQKEACLEWSRCFREKMYQQLAIAIIQSISKGTRETEVFLENMEREAFLQRIDNARKEGEKASTRLLFPMIVLLSLVMILVMFPAIVQFQSF